VNTRDKTRIRHVTRYGPPLKKNLAKRTEAFLGKENQPLRTPTFRARGDPIWGYHTDRKKRGERKASIEKEKRTRGTQDIPRAVGNIRHVLRAKEEEEKDPCGRTKEPSSPC